MVAGLKWKEPWLGLSRVDLIGFGVESEKTTGADRASGNAGDRIEGSGRKGEMAVF